MTRVGGLLAFLSVLIVSATPGNAEQQETKAATGHASRGTVTIPFRPEIGSVWQVTIEQTKRKRDKGVETASEGTAISQIEFGERTPTGYRVIWKNVSVTAGGTTISSGPLAEMLLIGVPIRYETGPGGGPMAVENLDEIIPKLVAMFEAMDGKPGKAQRVGNMIARMTPENAATMLGKELGILAICQDTKLVHGKPLRYSEPIPNVFGGPPMEAVHLHRLSDIDEETGMARIFYRRVIDSESALDSISEAIDEIQKVEGLEPSKGPRPDSFANATTVSCTVDLETGMTMRAEYALDASIDPQNNSRETKTITLERRSE